MKQDEAKKVLLELRDSLNEVLNDNSLSDAKEKSLEFRDSAKEDKSSFFKKMLDKAREIPVVDTFSQLGVAGSVAISSAAITQTDLAKDMTEVFVAEVANDVVEQRIQPPEFMNDFIDFYELNNWGEVIIAEKYVEAQSYVSGVSEQIQIKIETGEIPVSKSSSSDASPSQPSAPDKQPPLEQEVKTETKQQTKPTPEKQESKAKESPEEEPKEEKVEESLESNNDPKQENVNEKDDENSNPSTNQEVDKTNEVKTPYEEPIEDVKPHSMVVSPI